MPDLEQNQRPSSIKDRLITRALYHCCINCEPIPSSRRRTVPEGASDAFLPCRRSRRRILCSRSYAVANLISASSVCTYGSSISLPSISARICSASSALSLATSHRGDSGSQGTVAKRTKMKMNCSAKGTRQATFDPTLDLSFTLYPLVLTPPGRNENPKVTQFDSENPAMLRINSMTINFPRHDAFDVSACHGGA